jgi:hypothetical protein
LDICKILASFNNHEEACNMLVEKAGFEPRTLGTTAERYDHCTTRPVGYLYIVFSFNIEVTFEIEALDIEVKLRY